MVAAALRTIFAHPWRDAAGQQPGNVLPATPARWPKGAELPAETKEDLLAYTTFPAELWTRIYSRNPLGRLNKDIKRRTSGGGVFPDAGSVIPLVGSVLMRLADE